MLGGLVLSSGFFHPKSREKTLNLVKFFFNWEWNHWKLRDIEVESEVCGCGSFLTAEEFLEVVPFVRGIGEAEVL